MITPPLVMVDLDNSFDRAKRTITDPQAEEIIYSLNSYTGASPNKGLHVLCFANRPGKNIHSGIEIYGLDRIALTRQMFLSSPLDGKLTEGWTDFALKGGNLI
jgi:hypothetical protein